MTKMLRLLVLVSCVAAACASPDTPATVPEPVAEANTAEDAGAAPTDTTTTTDPEPVADPDADEEPGAASPDTTTTTVPEPVVDLDTVDDPDTQPSTTTTTTAPEPVGDSDANGDSDATTTTTTTTTTSTTTTTTTTPPTTTTTPPPPDPVADRLPADPDVPVGEWVAGVNAAGWGFHRHLEGNAVSSPMSIGMAFSLSRAGASAGSGVALDGIFGFPEAGTHSAANAVDLRLAEASAEPTTLEVANRLFPDEGFSLLPAFLVTAARQYGADLQPVDTSNGAAAAAAINRWVSDRTRGLIPTIVDPGAVQNQKLVLVNTVYLKADWLLPFLPDFTSDGPFITGADQSVAVPFMRDQEPVHRRFVRLEGADAVELPYVGGELAMWLVVPHDPAGLATVEESLDAATLTGLSDAAQTGRVDVTMPKWELTLPPTDLFEWLCPLGFCAGAGFEGIAPGIFLSAALHGAKVIVDEKGTEAAAATAGMFPTSMPPPPDLTIVADRPFLWAIVHQDTGALLFVGRLVNPAG
ncbi:MAG: serpin family protein [Acidimicrobiaceae bacterium]|nr:serpin family protein [Acidimicrobiaceae bacterium]MYE96288.1 serpin family protein [Acidimicrobiaceae bacterium]MYI55212.1 serpin family protein [Acidimicrobiaceae bacterium]